MPAAEAPARATTLKRPVRLRDVQRAVGAAVFQPLTTGFRTRRTQADGAPTAAVAEAVIRPNDRLSSVERLEIYNRQYWFRLYDCFGDDFPALRAVLGKRRFHALATAYLAARPSRSYTLRNLGQFLVDFLPARPDLTAPHTQAALDVARFEWAQVVAFDAAARRPVCLADIAAADPAGLTLALQPHVTLLDLGHACDDYALAVRARVAAAGEDAVPTIRLRPKRGRVCMAVHRHENSVYFKRLTPGGFALLAALGRGEPLAAAVEVAAAADADLTAETVRRWFEVWAALGWFTRRV